MFLQFISYVYQFVFVWLVCLDSGFDCFITMLFKLMVPTYLNDARKKGRSSAQAVRNSQRYRHGLWGTRLLPCDVDMQRIKHFGGC